VIAGRVVGLAWAVASLAAGAAGCTEDAASTERFADAGDEDGAVELDAALLEPDAGPADAGAPDAWVDPCPRVRVTTVGERLNVRATPSLGGDIVTTLEPQTIVDVLATVTGDDVGGETTWYEIDTHALRGYVTAAFAECTPDDATFGPFDGFRLPLECGTSARISQGNNSSFSHNGLSAYAFDFSLARGTSLHAMADGVVSWVQAFTGPGDPCYDGGGSECVAAANIVKVRHADGTITGYAHLDAALVEVGQSVRSGTAVGLSGSSGWSTGPHAHVAREEPDCGSGCQTVPLAFLDVDGDGVPVTNDTVTSDNCAAEP
jgi:hypothetical protein